MEKKRVLVFIDWFLPGYKAGGPIQSVSNLVDHLRDDFHFLIVTRDTDYCENVPYSTIQSNQWNVLKEGVEVFYFSKDQLTRANIRQLIKKTPFDSIYLNGIYSLYFTLIPLIYLRKRKDKNIVIAARGMLAESALDVKKIKKQLFIRTVKFLKLFDNVVFHATNDNEQEDIYRSLGGNVKIRVAANLFQKTEANALIKRLKKQEELRLVNVARLAPEKNLLYALKALKQVKEQVVFDFYGPVYDQEYWAECKLAMDELPQNVTANYKGSIESSKVMELLTNYHMMFMPTAGENFGHIILQSFSAGCPVIISDQTPWRDLDAKDVGWDIPLDNMQQFAAIIDICSRMNQSDYDLMSERAYLYGKQYVQNKEIVEQNRLLFL